MVGLVMLSLSLACGGSAAGPATARASLFAGFEHGFAGVNLAGVGEVLPTVVERPPGSGKHVCSVVLRGNQNRSEMILGGDGGTDAGRTVEFENGDEAWLSFAVDVIRMHYGRPGVFNLFMQFKGEGEGSPNFALQLGERGGRRGIYSSGPAMGAERLLAPLARRRWHRIELQFRASNRGHGFYRLFVDGRLADRRQGVSMIPPNRRRAYIKLGLYRDGNALPGTSKLLIDSIRLGAKRASASARGTR